MLTTLFGSRLRARLIAWLMTHSDEWFFVRRLTGILGEDSTNLSRELARLAGMGILISRTEGRQKYYRANENSPIFPELRSLAVKTGGIADILRSALAPLAGRVQIAFIYGSFAEGREREGSDVDLMILGEVQLRELVKALQPAQETLGREVNPVVYPAEEFRARMREGNHFLLQVLSGGKLFLMGGEDELTRLAS
jgi:uncharacterized protein